MNPKCFIPLKVSKQTLNSHKSSNLADPAYGTTLPPLEDLPPAPKLQNTFKFSSFSRKLFEKLIHSRRNGSAPGINMIPYKVYKKCPQTAGFLFHLFVSCLKHNVIPVHWRLSTEVYIPKTKPPNSSTIEDFRPIALLNVEGKLFFSLLSKQMEKHIIHNNKLINTSIQKGCMEKVPGCWEHMSMVWSALKSAKSTKQGLCAAWLDIANAFGSVPHRLIFFALKRYGIPDRFINLIRKYYSGLWSKSFSEDAPSDWHQHLRGIFVGCTSSIILFLAAINVIIEFTCHNFVVNPLRPPLKAFMDDLLIMTPDQVSTQHLLNRCTQALTWAGMTFKPTKSRSIVVVKGRIINSSQLIIVSDNKIVAIPSILTCPVRFLGRTINHTLSDKDAIDQFISDLYEALQRIDKSNHKGIHKVWILHHLLIPRARWPLLIYEVSITVASKAEQKISFYLRKWLKLQKSVSNLCLYSSCSPCPLPLKGFTSVLKSAKVSGHLLLRDSVDPAVAGNLPHLKVGKWSVKDAVIQGEEKLHFEQILGYHQTNKAGFGSIKKPVLPDKSSHEYRKLVSSKVDDLQEEQHLAQAAQLEMQGHWMKWCNYVKMDLSWKHLLSMPQCLVSFCISATYNTLPSPSNLKRWNKSPDSECFLCHKKVCTIPHILSGCKVALDQGRFNFRHDSVLKTLETTLSDFLPTIEPIECEYSLSSFFVKASARLSNKKTRSKRSGLLHSATDWKLSVDYDGSLVFPHFIALSQLRPDMVLYSFSKKIVILIELTCPCEENFEDRHRDKMFKYTALTTAIRNNRWTVHFFAIEVGARGYCANSVRACLSRLGLSRKLINTTLNQLSFVSLKASFVIWLSRASTSWEQAQELITFHNSQNLNLSSNQNTVTSDSVISTADHTPNHSLQSPVKTSKPKSLVSHKVLAKHATSPSSANCYQTTAVFRPGFLNKFRPGFLNKGNSCYINSIIQAVSTMRDFWSSTASKPNSPVTSHFLDLMGKMSFFKSALDPSAFITPKAVRSGHLL